MPRVLHVSDLHFGRPSVPEQIEAIETLIQAEKFDVVAISGDLTQRARAGEFQRARVFIRDAERVSKVVVIPGNHDVIWWKSPFDTGDDAKMYDEYRTWITGEMEPCLRVPGAVFVGINTSQGVTHRALTWRLKDLSVIGAVRREQLERAAREFATAAPGDARVIVMHHNPVKGELWVGTASRTRRRSSARSRSSAWTSCCAATITRRPCTTSSTRRRAR
jgi:3',5'-cyclic AMP phosphodiesterase CpdA